MRPASQAMAQMWLSGLVFHLTLYLAVEDLDDAAFSPAGRDGIIKSHNYTLL